MATRERERSWELGPIPQRVAILDAGAQYGMDIESQLKRQGFYAERLPFETTLEGLRGYSAIILSGGPESVYDADAPRCDPRILSPDEDRPPVLGICYGAHLINLLRGGTVAMLARREDGFTDITISPDSALFNGLNDKQEVLMSHGDTVVELAPGFEAIAYSDGMVAAIANPAERLYGLQFHPEVSTIEGPAMLRNFAQSISGMEGNYVYSYEEIIKDTLTEVREKVGKHQVLAFISGGVDSACLAALLERALPSEQLFLVHIDNGLMRRNESQQVVQALAEASIDVRLVNAAKMFLGGTTTVNGAETPPLYEVIDPEIKRKIIGDVFIKVQDNVAKEIGLDAGNFMLAMGTLHTDLIESGSKHASGKADVIKSHHNDTEAVRQLRDAGRVIEPWRNLQKDDVRQVGRLLGLPKSITERQPFPGPGLAIRIICAKGPMYKDNSELVAEQLTKFNTERIKTALLPIQTVGVQGDHRTYGHLAALSGEANWSELVGLARLIPRTIHDVNRVVYLFGEPVEGKIDSVTPTRLTPDVIDQIRHIDSTVNRILARYGLDRSISQVPVVSFPVNFGELGKRSIGIRTIMTPNFKSGDIAVPGADFPLEALADIVYEVGQVPGIARIAYDLTSKPPGTTEWE